MGLCPTRVLLPCRVYVDGEARGPGCVHGGGRVQGQHLRAVVGCALTYGLANSVFVVVIVMGRVAMTIMQIVHVIAMRDGFVPAPRAMNVVGMAVDVNWERVLVLDTCHTANHIAVCDGHHRFLCYHWSRTSREVLMHD